jgi:hypothetical protein
MNMPIHLTFPFLHAFRKYNFVWRCYI